MKSLIIIEPWCCHYEILPSIIDSTKDIYKDYIILSEDNVSSKHAIEFLENENNIYITDNIFQILSYNSSFDIWLNTSHKHGSEESFHQTTFVINSIREKARIYNIFCVIHNKIDQKWLAYQLSNQSFSQKVIAVYLSNDSKDAYAVNTFSIIFRPYCLDVPNLIPNYLADTTCIKLAIVGMCRAGKRFSELYRFNDLINEGKIEFVYSGWAPKATRINSGIKEAITNGYVSQCLMAEHRIKDIDVHEFLNKQHAIVDLKIIEDSWPIGLSSGNIGISRALRMPLIAHERHYPDFHCIRFTNYSDLHKLLSDHNRITQILKRYRSKLLNEYGESKVLARHSILNIQNTN